MIHNKLKTDLEYIVQHTQSVWDELKDQRIFITGGTGFFGTWLLEVIAWANQKKNLNISTVVLTRDPSVFAKQSPHLFHNPSLQFHQGDIRDYVFPEGYFSHMIHAATSASATLNQENPLLMRSTIEEGTKRVLNHACESKVRKFLLVSSGAVYGKQPAQCEYLNENDSAELDSNDPLGAYAIGKSKAEKMCLSYVAKKQYEIKIARCFAFVGPYLPLDTHFAIGNFIRDGLLGKTIHVKGDGTAYRSYLYAADLVIALLTILCQGESMSPYNVGSSEAISIAELAKITASCFDPPPDIRIAQLSDPNQPSLRYVPLVQRLEQLLGSNQKISLRDSIYKTIEWYRDKENEL